MFSISVLVLSCDKYSDLWDGFFSLFFKNFNYEIKIYLANNLRDFNFKDRSITVLNCGEDKNWSNHLLNALNCIDEDFIFIILEDLFIINNIKNSDISKLINFAFENNIQHLKYTSFPMGDIQFKDGYKKYSAGMPYSVSVNGIWNKKYLMSLLLDGESAWDFEINGSYRSKFSNERFYCPTLPLFTYLNMVEKGKWVLKNVAKAQKLGIKINIDGRGHRRKINYSLLNSYFNFVIRFVPYRYRVKFIGLIKKILISY